jgi:2-C-methyl-D-erythritol 4-phosphate cytidylyltransferase/2-C-methyl-D-erythritol 2,4-cyclodiphosphate synthase
MGVLKMRVGVIIAAGGRGERLGAGVPKQLLTIGGRPILQRSLELFAGHPRVDRIVVVLPPDLAANPPAYLSALARPVTVVAGGARRQDSVANGFAVIRDDVDLVVVHDAARPFASADLVDRTIEAAWEAGAALAALPASDTVKLVSEGASGGVVLVDRTVPRERVCLAQTPQAFRTQVLAAAIAAGQGLAAATDEAALAEAAGFPVRIVTGETTNLKITTMTDLTAAQALSGRSQEASAVRVGTGYDLHRLAQGRPLILGGVTIPWETGLVGHSDADVLSHAITDAILGAIAQGDIGRHFPDTDPRWTGASSLAMLAHAVRLAAALGFSVSNVDAVVVAERPKLVPHVDAIRASLASVLGVSLDRVSVKGKTNEGVDAIGRGEAMAVHAVAVMVASQGPA